MHTWRLPANIISSVYDEELNSRRTEGRKFPQLEPGGLLKFAEEIVKSQGIMFSIP